VQAVCQYRGEQTAEGDIPSKAKTVSGKTSGDRRDGLTARLWEPVKVNLRRRACARKKEKVDSHVTMVYRSWGRVKRTTT
jgi:hypothetical protein